MSMVAGQRLLSEPAAPVGRIHRMKDGGGKIQWLSGGRFGYHYFIVKLDCMMDPLPLEVR